MLNNWNEEDFVSILVLLEVPLQRIWTNNRSAIKKVSILVLLEVPLQLNSVIGVNPELVGFNPCFTGSTTSTRVGRNTCTIAFTFQSLFYWKYHFNTKQWSGQHRLMLFQSLFYWKYHFNVKLILISIIRYSVSILVLLEVPLQHSIKSKEVIKWLSFNPCFTGSTTSTNLQKKP